MCKVVNRSVIKQMRLTMNKEPLISMNKNTDFIHYSQIFPNTESFQYVSKYTFFYRSSFGTLSSLIISRFFCISRGFFQHICKNVGFIFGKEEILMIVNSDKLSFYLTLRGLVVVFFCLIVKYFSIPAD